jgi:hypothetical protein
MSTAINTCPRRTTLQLLQRRTNHENTKTNRFSTFRETTLHIQLFVTIVPWHTENVTEYPGHKVTEHVAYVEPVRILNGAQLVDDNSNI